MDSEQRKAFWETLLSLDGNDVEADRKKLDKKILPPRFLYRYRPVNIKTLEGFRTNRLYFSTANYYDDPFDTFINVNIHDLDLVYQNQLSTFNEEHVFNSMKAFFDGITASPLGADTIKQMIQAYKVSLSNPAFYSFVMEFTRNIRNEIKKDVWSACFSENGLNEVLWLKYAQQHTGFVLQYDMENYDLLLCGKQEKCKQCGVDKWGTPLYPVYYSDEQYDGTRFAQYITYLKLFSESLNYGTTQLSELLRSVITNFGNVNWERERITLIKKDCHRYDEEWRIILNCEMKGPVMREWIPSAVILGLNMGQAERNLTIAAAKEAGVKNIYQSFIDDSGLLNAK